MDLAHPLGVVTPTLDGDVLAVLALADASFTAPRVHELVGARSESGVRKVLDRLVGQGVVDLERVGRTSVYRLNRQHLAAPHVIALADLRARLLTRLRDAIGAWRPAPVYVALFGSTVRGTMRRGSDLDLFLVRPDLVSADEPAWVEQRSGLSYDVLRWTGNELRTIELPATDVVAGLGQDKALLRTIHEEGWLLYGARSYLARPAAGI